MSRNPKRQREWTRGRVGPRRVIAAAAVGLLCQILFLFGYRTVLAAHHARRAQQAVGAKRDAEAVERGTRALALNARQGYAAYFAGQAQRRLGRAGQAATSLRDALRTMAHRGQALRELAICEKELGEAAETAHLAEALAIAPLAPGHTALRARLGQLLLAQRHWAEGTAWFRSILAEEPQARFAFDGLAAGYEQLGLPDAALAAACGLLGPDRLFARARDHLLRLAQSAECRRLIREFLEALKREQPADDPMRGALERLLGDLADR